MNNDLISREALRKAINTYDTFACLPNGKLYPIRDLEHPEMFVTYIHVEDVIKAIDNAPTIYPICEDKACKYRANERPQGEWGKWVISEIQCPNCFGYFQTDCYSTEELNKCPVCGADMKGGAK